MLGFESLMLHWHGLLMGVGDLRFEFWKLLDRDMGEGRNASPGGSWVAQVFFFSFLFCGCWGLEGSRCLPNIGGILGNYSSNSVAILKGSYGVSVKARCSIELVPVGSGVFLENFYKNWFS